MYQSGNIRLMEINTAHPYLPSRNNWLSQEDSELKTGL